MPPGERSNAKDGPTQPVNMALVTGSGSPEDGRNPSFTLIEFDEEYMVPLNAYVYYMNLSEANADLTVPPKW